MKWLYITRIFLGFLAIIFAVIILFLILSNSFKGGILYLILILSSILFAFLISALISRSIYNEFKVFNNVAQKLANGDFNVKTVLEYNSGLRELAENFNQMIEKMGYIFNELSTKKEELKSVISSIQEGVLVLDDKGKIILCNDGFKKTFHTDLAEGRFYWEIIREPRFGEIVDKIMKTKNGFVEELKLNDKVFLCGANFLNYHQETVLTFYDITEIRNLENVKKDFIANLSHELRTPLTSIKGFVESLEDEVTEDGKHHLDIIIRNTDRLINIVKDLLLLSELESKGEQIELDEVDIRALINDLLSIFEKKANDKNIRLKFNSEENIPKILGDQFKLEQMLINLLENAIKYTEKGEVAVSLKNIDRNVIIEIQDTGIGIPESKISRIFERFYVVDKSRSRKLGGTGLGLSIVKHIVMLHNGKIDVESVLGFGTKFAVSLPIHFHKS